MVNVEACHEFGGGDILGYYTKGHVDIVEFCESVGQQWQHGVDMSNFEQLSKAAIESAEFPN